MKKAILISIILICFFEPLTYSRSKEKIPLVTAKEVLDEYNFNEIAARNKYEGNYFQVSGSVSKIYVSKIGKNPSCELVKPDKLLGLFGGVTCEFQDSENEKVAKLKPGQKVKVLGVIHSSKLWRMERSTITIKKCVFVDISKSSKN